MQTWQNLNTVYGIDYLEFSQHFLVILQSRGQKIGELKICPFHFYVSFQLWDNFVLEIIFIFDSTYQCLQLLDSFWTPTLSERIRGSLIGFSSLPQTRHFNTSLRDVSSTQGSVRFSFPKFVISIQIRHFNTSLRHKSVTSTQVRHSNTNSSLEHKSVTSSHHFNTSLQRTSVTTTQIRLLNTNPSLRHITYTCRGFFKCRICVDFTYLCGSEGLVSKWRFCAYMTNLCWSDVLKWRVCGSEGYSLFLSLICFLENILNSSFQILPFIFFLNLTRL